MSCEKSSGYIPEEDEQFNEKYSGYLTRALWKIASKDKDLGLKPRRSRSTIHDKRLVIDPTYTKLLIDEAARKVGGRSSLARLLKISRKTLKCYYEGRTTIPQKIYQCLSEITGIKVSVKKELSPNWGRRKGRSIMAVRRREALRKERYVKMAEELVKEKPEELAELIGRMLGDGSITKKNPCYYSSNLRAHERMAELVESLFGFRPTINPRKNYYRMNLRACITHVLNALGIPSGKKSVTNPSFPSFIFESESTMKAALRGFLSDEGYAAGDFVYVDISVRIPRHKLNTIKLSTSTINRKNDKTSSLINEIRSNLLEDVSKMLMKLSITHQLYPQRIIRNKSSASLIWRIKIQKDELLKNGIYWQL